MASMCDNCGCPLGAADIEASQCPVCRKTIWRHTVTELPSAPRNYRGTMVAPAFEEEDFLDESEAVDPIGASGDESHPAYHAIPATSATFDIPGTASLDDSTPLDAPEHRGEPGGLLSYSQSSPIEPANHDHGQVPSSSDAESRHAPQAAAIDVPSTAIASVTREPIAERRVTATIDARQIDEEERESWDELLAASVPPSATSGTNDDKASDTKASATSDTRYFGKTAVAARLLTNAHPVRSSEADYVVGEPLGAGGMGVVYQAVQRSINRDVALKMLKPEAARRRDRRDSLATEAIVTGELTHPNIVPIHDLGQDAAGNLFYSMKRVVGQRWDQVVAQNSTAKNIEVFLKVCDAIAFAHSRGVVHRDLKPENVLLGGFGEVLVMDWGLAFATDSFAKLDSITTNTSNGGSPAYMAPEQAANFLIAGGWRPGTAHPVTPATDIYLLGAILFEIATGQPPHAGGDPPQCILNAADNRIVESNSESELAAIAYRAMETEPPQRYGSVEELQRAVREFGSHAESVALAGRASAFMKSGELARAVVGFEDALELWPANPTAQSEVVIARRKLTQRRYALVAMTAAFLLAIFAGGYGINHQRVQAVAARDDLVVAVDRANDAKKLAEDAALRETEAKNSAQLSEAEAKASAAQERIAKVEAQAARDAANRSADQERAAREEATTAQRLAEKGRERQRYLNYLGRIKLIDARIQENAFAEADRLLEQLAHESAELCGWEWGRLKYLCTQGRRQFNVGVPLTAAAASQDGAVFVVGGANGILRGWRRGADGTVASDAMPAFANDRLGDVSAVAVTRDGTQVAAAGSGTPDIFIESVGAGEKTESFRLATNFDKGRPIVALEFSNDGSRLLAAGSGGVLVFDMNERRPVARKDAALDEAQPLVCAALSPDGTTVAAGLADGQVLVWPSTAKEQLFSTTLAFDGHRADTEFGDGFRFTAGEVTSLAFSADGTSIVSGGSDGRLLRWPISAVERQDDERDLAQAFAAAVGKAGNGRKQADAPPHFASVVAHQGAISTVFVQTNPGGGESVITGGADGLIKIWDNVLAWPDGASAQEPRAVLRGHDGQITSVSAASSPDGLRLFSAGVDTTARIWNIDRYGEVRELRTQAFADHEQEILAARFDPAGRRLATAGRDEVLVVTDLSNRESPPYRSPKIHSEAVSVPWVVPFPDGLRMATAYLDGSFAIWDLASHTTLARVAPRVGSSLTPPTVAPDGKWIAASWRERADAPSVGVWSVDELVESGGTAKPAHVFESQGEVFAICFLSATSLAYGDRPGPDRPVGGHVYVADTRTGKVETFRTFGDGVEGRVYALRRGADGKLLAAGGATAGAGVRVITLDPATGRADEAPVTLAGTFLTAISASSDGSRLVTLTNVGGNESQSLEVWDLSTRQRIWGRVLEEERATAIDLAPDGSSLLAVTEKLRRVGQEVVPDGTSVARLLKAESGDEVFFGENGTAPFLSESDLASRVSGAVYTPDGKRMLFASIRGVIEWDVERRERIDGAFDSHGSIMGVSFSADGRFLASGHRDGTSEIRDATSPQYPALVHVPAELASPVTAIGFSPVAGSYRFALAAGGDLSIREFDPAARTTNVLRKMPMAVQGGTIGVRSIAFDSTGRWLAAAGDDGMARFWDTEQEGEPILLARDGAGSEPIGHTGPLTSVAMPRTAVPEGFQVVATGGEDRIVMVWIVDLVRHRVVGTTPLRGHRGRITDLAFLPGRFDTIVSASDDGTAKLWDWDRDGVERWAIDAFNDLGEPEEVLTLQGRHTAGLSAVDVSSDGLTIVTAGRDGRAILWPTVRPPRDSTDGVATERSDAAVEPGPKSK